MSLIKRNGPFVVTSKSGEVLGEHKTKREAIAQLGAIEASKERKKK